MVYNKFFLQYNTYGYFGLVNSNFQSSDDEIYQNYQDICSKLKNEQDPQDVQELNILRESYQQICKKELREEYLNMLKIPILLMQPINLISTKAYVNRVHLYQIFAVYKKVGNEYQPRLLMFNFQQRTLNEYNQNKLVQGYVFSAITGGMMGFKSNEFVLNISDKNLCNNIQFKTLYDQQSELIVQLILLAMDTQERFKMLTTEKINKGKYVYLSDLKLLKNDRIIPMNGFQLFNVQNKNKQKLQLVVGATQVLLLNEQNEVIFVIPVHLIQKWQQKENQIIIPYIEDLLTFEKESDIDELYSITSEIYQNFNSSQLQIHDKPYMVKDTFIKKFVNIQIYFMEKEINMTKLILKEQENNLQFLNANFRKKKMLQYKNIL